MKKNSQEMMILIWLGCILGSLQLNFESFHSNLETIHGLNSCLCTGGVIKADKAEALALVGGAVNEDLAADNIAEG